MRQVSEHLFLFEDTCNVYVVRSGQAAVLVDFGSGAVLDQLDEIGVERVTAVLMTHHHRDQAQGLPRAVTAGVEIWVPHTEQDLFHNVEAHWQSREIYNNYNSRQDRFTLLESLPDTSISTLGDYMSHTFNGVTFTVLPTPGHTTGSITLLAEIDGQPVAFSGDLIAAPGKVWAMSATQWTYNGVEGISASIASLLDLKDRQPVRLFPSHGDPMDNSTEAIDLLVERLWELLQTRQQNLMLLDLHARPYEPITPHLLKNRTSISNSFVLLSKNAGKALVIDFGYDFSIPVGLAAGFDRASRRPWLHTLPALKQQFGVQKIDVVMPTHYHDDHVAGINLLRKAEGTQVWAADWFADLLERPAHYDLPCLWYDPIPVDRQFPLETPFQWEEYTFTFYALPGHTRYAVAILFEVDGQRVIATGDQYSDLDFNYVYPNRFDAEDYVKSAELYQRLQPDWIITGHWEPRQVTADYLGQIGVLGSELMRQHRDLLPQPGLGDEGFIARLTPYQSAVPSGETLSFEIELRNPFDYAAQAALNVITPAGWQVVNGNSVSVKLEANAVQTATFKLIPSGSPVRRARIAVDVQIGDRPFGQQAEALVTII